jgi:hypothetical protein
MLSLVPNGQPVREAGLGFNFSLNGDTTFRIDLGGHGEAAQTGTVQTHAFAGAEAQHLFGVLSGTT